MIGECGGYISGHCAVNLLPVRALLCTSAGAMGLDVLKTRIVVTCSTLSTAWEFSQDDNVELAHRWLIKAGFS